MPKLFLLLYHVSEFTVGGFWIKVKIMKLWKVYAKHVFFSYEGYFKEAWNPFTCSGWVKCFILFHHYQQHRDLCLQRHHVCKLTVADGKWTVFIPSITILPSIHPFMHTHSHTNGGAHHARQQPARQELVRVRGRTSNLPVTATPLYLLSLCHPAE